MGIEADGFVLTRSARRLRRDDIGDNPCGLAPIPRLPSTVYPSTGNSAVSFTCSITT
jgi:hypothetical protein